MLFRSREFFTYYKLFYSKTRYNKAVPVSYTHLDVYKRQDNEVFAYYELIPYNYSFLSAEQKFIVHDSFRQLIAQSREGKIHALQIATESSIRSQQEQSKKLVTGKVKEVAYQKINEQTEALVSMIGDNQVDYRFFLGFKPVSYTHLDVYKRQVSEPATSTLSNTFP